MPRSSVLVLEPPLTNWFLAFDRTAIVLDFVGLWDFLAAWGGFGLRVAGIAMPVVPAWRLVCAVVALEMAPHPPSCSDYDEDGCDCGVSDALDLLYPLVDAGPLGIAENGSPLQQARRNYYDGQRLRTDHDRLFGVAP